ncbi:MAG: response regulator, partial [Bacteroidaceae bacterium]|nr:response regulator [Bacteroidaceae bacterium]
MTLLLMLAAACAGGIVSARTTGGGKDPHQQKTLLVVSSYDEGEPWSNSLVSSIVLRMAAIDSVKCEIANLENAFVKDSVALERVGDNVISQYAAEKPSYVVLVGNFSFNLRDKIKAHWGDIPMLLITRSLNVGERKDYYANTTEFVSESYGTPIESIRDHYNLSVIYIPDLCKETVDLMVRMNPDMTELVFFTTNIFVQRRAATSIEEHLAKNYPQITFKKVRANAENAPKFHEYMVARHPEAGLLLGSWVYEKQSPRGATALTSNDMRLVASSKNPIYTLRQAYMDEIGCIGGAFVDNEEVKTRIYEVIAAMLEGRPMNQIPLIKIGSVNLCMDYGKITDFRLSASNCPEGTLFINKPQTFIERYLWQMIVASLLGVMVMAFFWVKLYRQRERIHRLRTTARFLNSMPVPYAKATIKYDEKARVQTIAYENMNNAFEQIVDRNKEPDRTYLLFPHDFIAKKVAELMRTKTDVNFIYHFEKTDTYYEFTLCNVLTKDYGTINVLDIFANDITNRFWMSERLRIYANRLELALTKAHLAAWEWDLANDVITYDDCGMFKREKSYKVTKREAEDWVITSEDFFNHLHPEDRTQMLNTYMDIKTNSISKFERLLRFVGLTENAPYEWVEFVGEVTKKDSNGRATHMMGSCQIVTEKINHQNLLLDSLEKAREADRMKTAFIQNMSHEIRTPLNAIVGFSNLLADTDDADTRKEFRDIINLNNDIMLNLVNDILDLAKVESNTIELNYAPTDLNLLLRSAERSVRNRLQPGVELHLHTGLEECAVETDAMRLTQVITNLLTNACKFTPQGQIDLGYELCDGDSKLYFYVKDTGLGLSEESQKVVFERFVKLNDFIQGTGLGLPICVSFIELMNGEFGVESEGEGKGSLFWFKIPYKPCEAITVEPEEWDRKQPVNSDLRTEMEGGIGGRQPVLLIAEDNDSNYRLAAHMLKDDYAIIHAHNGVEALNLFIHQKPDGILMDINMPVMDGYECTRRIREISKTVPIIACTANAFE